MYKKLFLHYADWLTLMYCCLNSSFFSFKSVNENEIDAKQNNGM